MLAVLHSGQKLTRGGPIALQVINHDHARHIRQPLEEFAEELLRCRLIATALDQDIEDMAVLIRGPTEIVLLTMNGEKHLIQMPLVAWLRAMAPELIGIRLAERPAPLADRLIRHNDPACEQPFLNIAIAEAESEVQPHTVADDLSGEAVVLIAVGHYCGVHATMMSRGPGAV